MENRYKIILSGNQIYKEAELPADMERVTVGTGIDCTVRLRRDLFFESIQIEFVKESGGWRATCSDNIYFTEGDIRKYMTRKVIHGDTLEVRYQESEGLVFRIDFQIDFDSGSHRCERMINLDRYQTISIGNNSAYEIALSGVYAKREFVRLTRGQGGWTLEVMNSEYGVYHNGKKTEQKEWIKDGNFFSVADYYFFLKGNALWAEIRSDLTVNGLGFGDYLERNGYPRFSRNTRLKTVICEDKIEILDPPSKPQKPKSNLFMKLFPSFGMLIAAGAMAFMGGTMIIFSLISCTIAIITAVVGVMEGKKEFREKTANRIEVYQKYIASKRQEIEECRNREWTERNEIYIPAEQEIQQVETFSPDLFDRTPQDEDFLCVRLGSGPIESARQVNYKKQEKLEIEDDLSLLPEQTASFYKELQNAPVICDLKNVNAVGITGEEADRFELLKLIVTDVALRHFAADVKLFFVAEKEHAGRMHLFRFLPGAYCVQTDTRGIVTDDESKTLIFEYLYKELTMRAQEKRSYPHLLIFFYDEYGYKKHPISQFTEKGKDLGVTFLFFGQTRADIPVGCDYVVQLSGGYRGVLINAAEKSKTVPFVSSQISDTLAVRIVRTLAPVCTDEVSLEGELIKNISMFKMLNILSVEDLDLKARWSASKVTKSMAAPVGVSKTGIVMLDLHDKAHGPHGLVAGTTGSGKSEILQTYILSMATLYHPYEAAFVIIDFKGGGMVNQFAQLPHLLGAITNIDGNAINRSLKSIKAELQKRQKYFAQADVNHIDKYIRKYKAGEVSEPLPHLIIIVDEFAELKAEQPEFMKELISAARIGRSLGVHLILATQKPAGQVNEQIWSNSRFKLCLKVQSKEDSNEVLKSPLAAEIKEPGRAYLQVGNNEIFELFQSAYSGVPEREDEGTGKAFTIYEVPDGGKKVPVYVKKKNKGQEGMNNQLEAIVSYVSEYFRSIQIPQLPDICLPPLRECIEFPPVSKEAVQEQKKEVGFYAWIGVYDDPDHQNQDQYAVNLSAANMIIIGSAQTGKTTILQNVIRSLSEQYTPDEVAIYIIDFASMVLKNFETLNHVGGVVSSSEDEKLKNLFKMLWEEMETRKEKLLSVGVSSFVAYKEAGRTDMKQIVLIIDNLTALKELYFQDDDELLNLCREGITVGISIVIANAQTAGIGYKYLSSFSNRIALFCNDGNEYSAIFEHCNRRLEHLPGRCFAEVDKQILECQAYLPFAGEKEFERAEAIRGYIEKRNGECTEVARKIPLIPPVLSMNYMAQQFGNMMRGHFDLAAGLNYEDVMPYMLRMSSIGVLAVVGREGSGRYNWIKYVADMLELMYPGRSKVYISDGIGKKLASMKEKRNVVRYSMIAEDIVSYLKEIEEELQSRYELLAKGIESDPAEADYMLLIIDNPDAIEQISNSKEALASYKNIIGRYRNMNVGVIISAIENAPIPYSAPEVIKGIRDGRHLMYFGDISELKIYDMPLAVTRKFKKPIETGDGYYIKENECIKLKTPFIAGE